MDTVEQIEKRLNKLEAKFPPSPKVARFVVEDGRDWMGEPALFIWVLLDNDTTREEPTGDKLGQIDKAIADAIRERDDPRFPFVRFRTEAEHTALTQG